MYVAVALFSVAFSNDGIFLIKKKHAITLTKNKKAKGRTVFNTFLILYCFKSFGKTGAFTAFSPFPCFYLIISQAKYIVKV